MGFIVVLAVIGYLIYYNQSGKGKKRTNYRQAYVNRQTADFSAYRTPSNAERAGTYNTAAHKTVKKDQPKSKAVTVLLVVGIVFLLIGFMYFTEFLDDIGYSYAVSELANAVTFLAGGAASLFARYRMKKRLARLAKYIAVMGNDDCKSVAEVAKATGLPRDKVRKDLEFLANRGDFGDEAYFDNGLDSLVTSEQAAEKERQLRQQDKTARKTQAEREANTTEYMRIYEEMREAAGAIHDTEISGKMMKLTELTGKILSAAESNPEKEKDIRRFMSYYLPQTQKLMRSYATLEKQGVATANISSTKDRIGNILDNLITGYEQQLDKMFDSDALDISSDIDVLETMLKQDGLSGNTDGLTLGGH